MKKRKIFIITTILILAALVSFSVNNINQKKPFDSSDKDTIQSNPKIDIKVEKEYDDDGNIIRYDSSYTYIYQHSDGNYEELDMDSIFRNFKPFFFDHGFEIMQSPFDDFFDHDTLYQRHFFDDDYFMQHFNQQMFQLEDMMKEMDSLRNLYLKNLYPEYQNYPEINKDDKPKKGLKKV